MLLSPRQATARLRPAGWALTVQSRDQRHRRHGSHPRRRPASPHQSPRSCKAIAAGGARLTKGGPPKPQVTAWLKRGARDGALGAPDGLLANPGTRNYRAQTLTSMGTIARDAEYRDRAIKAYATV